MEATFTGLIHAESKTGKSWLGDTVPAPRLILDAEGRAYYTPSQPKITWNPLTQPVPVYDGSWQTCVVDVQNYTVLDSTWQILRSGNHPFVSTVMDSVMEAQKRCIDAHVPGVRALERDDYSVLLREMDLLIRKYRDLPKVQVNNPMRVMIFLSGTTWNQEKKKYEPLLAGAIRTQFAYYMDVVGYMFKEPDADGRLVRKLLVDEHPSFVAGDGTNVLKSRFGPVISLPDTDPPSPYLTWFYDHMRADIQAKGVTA